LLVDLAEHHQWWKHQGGQELRRLLMEQWDPIGVKNWHGAAIEYDGYRGGVVQLLRDGASGEDVAEYLSQVERERMDMDTTREQLRSVGERLVGWYAASIARWEAAHQGGSRSSWFDR
jgi:hypothetical protein